VVLEADAADGVVMVENPRGRRDIRIGGREWKGSDSERTTCGKQRG
jgi:hypothetical protein